MSDLLLVNGRTCPCPSEMTWGKQDVSDAQSGRDQTAYMNKNKIAEKRKLQLKWNAVTPEKAHEVLSLFADEYFNVTYYDPLIGGTTTKEFYCGDMSAPFRLWVQKDVWGKEKKIIDVSFDIIER